jgi:Kef-type K+ transport system membrane component KefB
MEAGGDAGAMIVVSGAIALAAAAPALLRVAILPAVVMEILLGILIGPQGLGLADGEGLVAPLSEMGLAVLFLMAGLEVNPDTVRGAPMRLALRGWVASLALAGGLALGAAALGLVAAPAYVAIAISTTAIGALLPVLKDEGLLGPPYGPFVLAAGAVGEALPLVVLSLFLAGAAGVGVQGAVLGLFGLVAALAITLANRLRQGALPPVLRATMESSGQFPIRFALFLTVVFVFLGESLGLDLVLGAFVAGAVLRAMLPHDLHDALMDRLAAVGYGFLVPVFFVASGMELDVAALLSAPASLLAIPVFLAMMLLARGLPVLWLYRGVLSPRQRVALALHSGTQLPLVVAVTALAVREGAMPGATAAALVMAALLSVMLFPALARSALRGRAPSAG